MGDMFLYPKRKQHLFNKKQHVTVQFTSTVQKQCLLLPDSSRNLISAIRQY